MTSSVIAVRETKDFKELEKKSKEKLVILEFMGSVTYRVDCEKMKPILDGIAKEKDAYFYTIDVDKDQFKDYVKEKKVQALPTFDMMKDTKTVKRLVVPDKEELTDTIDEALNPQIN